MRRLGHTNLQPVPRQGPHREKHDDQEDSRTPTKTRAGLICFLSCVMQSNQSQYIGLRIQAPKEHKVHRQNSGQCILSASYNQTMASRTALHRRTRQGRPRFCLSRHRNLAKPVSRLRNPHRRSRTDLGLPQNRPARLRRAHHPLHAPPALPGAEVAQGVSVQLPQPGHLPGKHRQPGAGGRGQGLRPGLGGGARRIPSPRRHRHHRRSPLAPAQRITAVGHA